MNEPVAPKVGSCPCGPAEFNAVGWWRVGVGLLIAANSMTISLAVSSTVVTRGEWIRIQGVLLALAVAALVVLGWPLARNTLRAFARRRITIEAMFLTGITGAMAGSVHAAVTGIGESYFEIVPILLVVYLLGQQLTGQVQDRAVRSASEWGPAMDRCLVMGDDDQVVEIPIHALRPGSRVVVPPGAVIAADGVIETGEAFVREAEMTGEPFVVVRRPGDRVWAGTHCVDARLTIRATSGGTQRRIDEILRAVDRARMQPSSLQALADRLVAKFLPTVIGVSTITFLGWTWSDGWMTGLLNAMAVLLVACPCALGLATPLVMWVAVARLAGRGLLIRNWDAIEALAAVDTVVFDKTGTLTEPTIRLVDLAVDPPPGMDRDDLLSLIEAVEVASRHPISAAFEGLSAGSHSHWTIEELTVLPAVGVRAEVRKHQEPPLSVVLGGAGRLDVVGTGDWERLWNRMRRKTGAREVAVVVNDRVVAAAMVDERLRASWPNALEGLKEQGISTHVLTGDSEDRARLTRADAIEFDLGPEQKLARVEDLRRRDRSLLFVGDGLNDAAAMAASDVSIAVAGGADLASEVADIQWYGEDLRSIPWALDLSRAAVRDVRGNLILAATYNVIGIGLAVCGVLHPVAAALLMTCSSVLVTWRALRGLDRDPTDAARDLEADTTFELGAEGA